MRADGGAQQLVVDDIEAGQLGDCASHVCAKQDAADHPRGNRHHLGVKVHAPPCCCGASPALDETARLVDHDVDVVARDAAPSEYRCQEATLPVPALVFAGEHVLAQRLAQL